MSSSNYLVSRLQELAKSDAGDAKKFLAQYEAVAAYLPTYYTYIQANCPYFTDHGQEHVNSVARNAGLLLQNNVNSSPNCAQLSCYDLFLLLMAIIWHDAGMALTRKGHEKAVNELIDKVRELALGDVNCQRHVQQIIQAHTGHDKLRNLRTSEDYHSYTFFPSSLASVLRFADEISEDNSRISLQVLESGKVPKDQELYWYYAKAISASKPDLIRERIVLTLSIDKSDAIKTFSNPKSGQPDITLIEYILSRVEKMHNERAYCAPYLSRYCSIKSIEVRMMLCNGADPVPGYDEDVEFGDVNFQENKIADKFFLDHKKWTPEEIAKIH